MIEYAAHALSDFVRIGTERERRGSSPRDNQTADDDAASRFSLPSSTRGFRRSGCYYAKVSRRDYPRPN